MTHLPKELKTMATEIRPTKEVSVQSRKRDSFESVEKTSHCAGKAMALSRLVEPLG